MADILLYRACIAEKDANGNPTGTYYQGQIYYSDVTKTIKDTSFSGATSCSPYNRPGDEVIDTYCDGDDKIEVYHIPGSGQIRKERTAGACEGELCNLFFENVTVSTTETGGNVSFTMNQAGIKYTLSDFSFGAPWGQTETNAGSFSNLEPGSYLLTVQKLGNTGCEATHPFTITTASYGLKWWFEYFDIHGVETRVEIDGKNFSGSASEIEYIGSEPVIFDWKGKGSDKYRQFVNSECRLNVVAKQDFEYITLFSSDEKEHRVSVYKSDVLFWRGFIVPDVYSEPYLSPPYNMQVSAVDGLNTLSNYEYDNVAEVVSLLDAAVYCLNKLELSLDIEEACFFNSTAPNQNFLTDLYVKGKSFEGLDCLEVLKRILFSQLARISQVSGRWHIKPIDQLIDQYDVRLYDFTGNFVSDFVANPIKVIGKVNDPIFFIEGKQNLTISPAYKELNIVYDYGREDQIVINSEFESLDKWGTAAPANLVTYRKDDGTIGNAYQFRGGTFTNRPSQTIEIEPEKNDSTLDISVEYRVVRGSTFYAPLIEITFEQGPHTGITIKINGQYYIFDHDGVIGSHINGTYLTAAANAQAFETWVKALAGISNYIVNRTDEVVLITAKTADVNLDYGDVEIEGAAKVTDRNNEIVANENKTVGLRVYAIDVNGNEKSLTTSGRWLEASTRLPIYTWPIPQTLNMPVNKNGKWEVFNVLTDALPDNTKFIKIEIIGYGDRNLYENFGSVETQYRKITATFLPDGNVAPKDQRVTIKNPSEAVTFMPPLYNLYLGSEPIKEWPKGYHNGINIFENMMYYKWGDFYYPVSHFRHDEEDGYLIDIIGKLMFANNFRPTQTITGTLRGDFNFNHSFVDPNNPGRLFIINSMKYNDRKKGYDVELVEMLSYSSGLVYNTRLLENGEYRLLEDDTIRMLE